MGKSVLLRITAPIFLMLAAGCTGRVTADDVDNDPGGGKGGKGGGQSMTGGSSSGGNGGAGNNNTGGSGTNTGGNGMTTTPGDPNAAGPMPLRRLNRREYNNTVRDLLGDTTRPADGFPPDQDAGFLFRRAVNVATQDAELFRGAAEALAAKALTAMPSLLPCDPKTGEEACAKKFIGTFGLRAFRRPLTQPESDRLVALYTAGRTTDMLDFNGAISLLIEAMLQSPAFIYRWELGTGAPIRDGKVVRLGPYEMASRLSYFLWGTMPDQALFDAAAANHLSTDAEIQAQATRMLKDSKAKEATSAFFTEWLDLDQVANRPKDPKLYPEFNDALKTAMLAESTAFANNVVFDGDGKFGTLLGASFSFVNQALGAVYGATAVKGTALVQTMLDGKQRSGLLTEASFLTVTGSTEGSHPVRRGRRIYERLLCGTLPPPPAVVPPPKPASAGGTTRDRFSEHDNNDCARGCHSLMDPLGFAFEHYDGIGRYRTQDNGLDVDSSGKITIDGSEKPFNDAIDLLKLLASSTEARHCFATQWTRFALGRNDTAEDRASVDAVVSGAAKGDFVVRDLIAALTLSRSFRYRSPATGETP